MIGATFCSGIGAPEVAATWVDWQLASEIEQFPREVLQHRFGHRDARHHREQARLWGDFTALRARHFRRLNIPFPNIIAAGTPCQSFSVAGLRKGLADDRGKKRRNVEAFTKGDSRVMMISLRSGSGLDGLQEYCSDVVVGELDWSPQVLKQLYGRLRRPGQRGQVTAHVLHTAGGSDPIMLDVLGLKGDQSRGIIRPGEEAEERERDDTRIQRLAEAILKGGRNA